jgi:ferritin-like metal-binding protein YciE
MAVASLQDLYIEELRDLYNAENQIVKALPKMAKVATNEELRAAFQEHLQVTEQQIERLEQIFESLGKSPKGKKCMGMEGLLAEGKEHMAEVKKGDTLDAALIGAAQKVEHYEIAGYGTARSFAETLGRTEDAQILQETLDEEAETDEKLTTIAEAVGVNLQAADEESEEDGDAVTSGSSRSGSSAKKPASRRK